MIFRVAWIFIIGLTACRTTKPETSSTKIINGTVISASTYPAVVPLTDDQRNLICTGTFVSARTVLTAAHCISGNSPEVVQFHGKIPSKILINSEHFTANDGAKNADIALLVFDSNLAPGVMPITSTPPIANDPFVIVGFGCTKLNTRIGVGTKRQGAGTITDIVPRSFDVFREGMVAAPMIDSSDPSFADSCNGDSGGPLIVNGEVAATVSDAIWGASGMWSFYVNLTTPISRSFLEQANGQGAGIAGFSKLSYTHYLKIIK